MITKLQGVTNLHFVGDGIYRSAHPTNFGYESLRSAQFRTLIDLCGSWEQVKRGEYMPYISDFEYHNIPLDGMLTHIRASDLMRIVDTLIYVPKPALVHCLLGADRTGAVVAAYRIMVNHMPLQEAIAEMKDYKHQWSYLAGGVNVERQLATISAFFSGRDGIPLA
jgi:tyrosine-protein phosphatase SIW14